MRPKNKQGFTLIELVVSLGLLLIVLAVGYMFFSYGTNTFASGEEQSNVQRDVRLICGEITRELRNVTEMSFLDTATPAAGEYNYIIFNSSDKTIKVYEKNATVSHSTNSCINTFTYSIDIVDGKYVMSFNVGGTEGSRTYSTESKVFLVNLSTTPVDSDKAYAAIKYKKP